MSSLIASHFPSFSSPFSDRHDNTSSIEMDDQNGRHLTDQELDFLVAILGLLVNLVEKDGQNRLVLLVDSTEFFMISFAVVLFLELVLGTYKNSEREFQI